MHWRNTSFGRRPRARVALALVVLGWPCTTATIAAEPVGTLRGRVVVVGEVAAASEIDPGRDACCIEANPKDESVIVGPDGGLANAVVYLRPRRGARPTIDEAPPSEPVVISNHQCAFTPRVVLLRVGQPLVLANDDPTTHNVSATTRRNGSFNLVLPPDDRRELKLDSAESSPAAIACNVHPFMRGHFLLLDHPHAAVTGPDGRFELSGLPAGEWRFQFWHETGELSGVAVGNAETDRRGRTVLEIEPQRTLDLGDIRVAAQRLR